MTGHRTRQLVRVALAVVLAATLASCGLESDFQCPDSIPGPPRGKNIPVLVVDDDTGRAAHPDQGGLTAPALACETDANRNGIGDEHEVEVLEEAMNGTAD